MKKFFALLSVVLICFCFSSCEKDNFDVLKGTWKNTGVNASTGGATELDLTYIFDGKGNFTFINRGEGITAEGTYTIEENNTIVRMNGVSRNPDGIEKEFKDAYLLDLDVTPPIFYIELYDQYGTYFGTLIFEKQ